MTDQARWSVLERVFHDVLELEPGERDEYIRAACGNDEELRRRLESLLGHDAPVVAPGGSPDASGPRIGPYVVTSKLGAGGMGEVYLARDSRLNRQVALKILSRQFANDSERKRRFLCEAQAASALNHPNIVTVYDVGTDGKLDYLVMEYVAGKPLDRLIPRNGLKLKEARQYAIQIADALKCAHAAGIIHRDLKPANVLINESGVAKVVDFGVAKQVRPGPDARTLTHEGLIVGTVAYMSPEQAEGKPVDARSDIFSFGSLLYEMITGRRAFHRDTSAATLAAVIHDEPQPVSSLSDEVPAELELIIGRCLRKDPAERFQTIAEVGAALTAARQSATAGKASLFARERTEPHPGAPRGGITANRNQPPRTHFRKPWNTAIPVPPAATVFAVALMLLAVAGAVFWLGSRPPDASRHPIIAVREFKNLSAAPSQEYFSSGMTEEIRDQLSKITAIRVLSRSAVDRYREGEIRRMRNELGAGSVVEGSVRLHNRRVRIAVQLTDARSEQTLWSREYDRTVEDVFAVQTEVALQIAGSLQTKLTPEERQRVQQVPTQNATAHDLYLRALKLRTSSREQNEQAIALLKQAVDLDPRFVPAMAHIAYRLPSLSPDSTANMGEATRWAQRALAIDPNSSDAHATLATLYLWQGMIAKARIEFLRALELNPSSTIAMANLSLMICDVGQFEEALHWARRALALDPGSSTYYHVAVPLLLLAGGAGEPWISAVQRKYPGSSRLGLMRAIALSMAGQTAAAMDVVRRVLEQEPDNVEIAVALADLALLAHAPDAERLNKSAFGANVEPAFGNYVVLPESARPRYAYCQLRRGDVSGARALLRAAEQAALRSWKQGLETPTVSMELAAIRALRNDNDGAMEWLERAYDAGWRMLWTTRLDPMLENLHADSRFTKYVRRMEADLQRMREHSTELPELLRAEQAPVR